MTIQEQIRDLWVKVYLTQIKNGRTHVSAIIEADDAAKAFRSRFAD